jgi:prepilin-type N-terminal cleavage/methylation domain-containing protein
MVEKEAKGFTLVELMIAMSISLTVLGAIFSLFVLAKRGYSSQEGMAGLQQNVRASLELMGRQSINLHWISALDCTPGDSSFTFYTMEESGTASGGGSGGLSDNSKSWTANKFRNGKVILLDGTGSESDEGTSTGSNDSAHLNDTDKSWQANKWQGYEVMMTGGAGFGQMRAITSNTATQLTVSPDWETVPGETSNYQIRQIRTIRSNTATRLTVSPDWMIIPDHTSLYTILRTRGFSRDPVDHEIDYTVGQGSQAFAEDIVGLTLQGYDNSDMTTCDPADMKRLEVTLTGKTPEPDAMNGKYRVYMVKTTIAVN